MNDDNERYLRRCLDYILEEALIEADTHIDHTRREAHARGTAGSQVEIAVACSAVMKIFDLTASHMTNFLEDHSGSPDVKSKVLSAGLESAQSGFSEIIVGKFDRHDALDELDGHMSDLSNALAERTRNRISAFAKGRSFVSERSGPAHHISTPKRIRDRR